MTLFNVGVTISFDPAALALLNRFLDMLDQTEQVKSLTSTVTSKTAELQAALTRAGSVLPPSTP